jgi:general secretion pathway protein D
MKICFAIFALFFCLASAAAGSASTPAEAKSARSGAPKPAISRHDREAAEKEFKTALELRKKGNPEEALLAAMRAQQLFPGKIEYVTLAELLRQQLVGSHLEAGNRLADSGDVAGAAREFQTALGIDPGNTYVIQRLHDIGPVDPDPEHRHTLELLASVDQINLQPTPGKKSIHAGGDTRQVYTQIGALFGVTMQFDQNMSGRNLRFDLDNVDFYTVMELAGKMTKTFWAPISGHEVIVANDTQDMRKQYERMALRTFYVGNVSSQTDLNDLVNVMRNILDMKLVSIQPGRNTITVRAPREQVEAAASMLDNLMDAKPELVVEVTEYEVDLDKARSLGLNLPTSFTVFNIPSEIRRVLGSAAQPVIDQLNSTGTIDPSKIPTSALQNLAGSPLLAPFIFFGKGLGLTGVTASPITAKASLNDSRSSVMEHMMLRATDGETATFRVGDRFPIVNSTFSNIAFSSRGQTQIGNTPQFTYEDLGITLKLTPHYHADGNVTLLLDLAIQGLGTLQLNNIPDITSRTYKGTITVDDGSPSVVMGAITDQETRSVAGLPGLASAPVLNKFLSSTSNEHIHNELLIVVTPHVVRKPFRNKGSSVLWDIAP